MSPRNPGILPVWPGYALIRPSTHGPLVPTVWPPEEGRPGNGQARPGEHHSWHVHEQGAEGSQLPNRQEVSVLLPRLTTSASLVTCQQTAMGRARVLVCWRNGTWRLPPEVSPEVLSFVLRLVHWPPSLHKTGAQGAQSLAGMGLAGLTAKEGPAHCRQLRGFCLKALCLQDVLVLPVRHCHPPLT